MLGCELFLVYREGITQNKFAFPVQLAEIIDIHEKQQMIDKDEGSIIRGAMTFGNKTARSIMTPVDQVFMAPLSAVLDRVLIHSILASGFSRVLVHGESVNDIIGTIHVKDLIFVDPKVRTARISLSLFNH